MGDVTKIKGLRRTSIRATAGKVVQAFMIDEIDKIGRNWSVYPISALLEGVDFYDSATLYIEKLRLDSESVPVSITVTGKLGDVMKESAEIASHYGRRYLKNKHPDNIPTKGPCTSTFPKERLPKRRHQRGVHYGEFAVFARFNRSLLKHVAMTGEDSLTGMVLPVGGIPEKAIAAKTSAVTEMILPEGNRKDWD